jgi:hypothetical protein
VLLVEPLGHGDAPLERRPRHAQVGEGLLEHLEDLRPAVGRLDKGGVVGDEVDELVLVPEEARGCVSE